MLYKFMWFLRGLIFIPFYGKFKLPSYIAKPIYISNFNRIFVGRKVRILPHSRIEVVNKMSKIVFEDNISVGQNFHITSGGELIIGKNTTIAENVMITNIDHEYKVIDKHILEQPYIIKETKIGQNCFIGYGAVIQAGTILGKQNIVGSNSVVRGKFPDYCVIVGSPARIVKRYNEKTGLWDKVDKEGNLKEN